MICKFAPTILSAVTNFQAKVFNEDGGQQKHVTHHFTRFVSLRETLA
jgi:hypothetical protein